MRFTFLFCLSISENWRHPQNLLLARAESGLGHHFNVRHCSGRPLSISFPARFTLWKFARDHHDSLVAAKFVGTFVGINDPRVERYQHAYRHPRAGRKVWRMSSPAETANGSGALALAALVGNVAPSLGAAEKSALMKLLDGKTDFSFPAGKAITVAAQKITCRAGNVDITSHSYDLTFGGQVVSLKGRSAHELFATLAEIGIQPDGAAGSIFEALSNLKCTIDPNEVKQKSGGGAECQYAPAN
jgi:hypothetical protein